MTPVNRASSQRRHFIFTVTGILGSLLIPGKGNCVHLKGSLRDFVGEIELANLQKARPAKDPGITAQPRGDTLRLYKSEKGQRRILCDLNKSGALIWQACNGQRTPREIAARLQEAYQVSDRQAYVDCLCFLTELKSKGALTL